MQDKESEWAGRLISYMAVLEQKTGSRQLSTRGDSYCVCRHTVWKRRAYNYHVAKRLLRLTLDELHKRGDLKNELGMDSESKGRPAITGREGTTVWDFLRLAQAHGGHTKFPHLTLSIGEERLQATVT